MTQRLGRYKLTLILLAVLAISTSCGNGGESAHDPGTEVVHSATWNVDHSAAYQKDQSDCSRCHGADRKGGISKVSCFSASFAGTNCHPNGPAGHPVGWSSPGLHGASAKAAPDQAGVKGFSSCETCHGPGFKGQFGPSCLSMTACHGTRVAAPHPSAPWRSAAVTHTTTDQKNADACALCHLDNRTPALYALPPAGVQAGCFNNTLCHGAIGHPAGWTDPGQHGAAAKNDFSVCTTCHGAAYRGGSAATTCYQCHAGPGLDHPAPGWVVADHKGAALADPAACRNCHGPDFLGGGAHLACKSCHMEDRTKVHVLNWYPDVQLNHGAYVVVNGAASCSNQYCHGTNLAGVADSGPSCSTCHAWPYTAGSCGSCHGSPPAGTNFPDTAGGHSVHTALGSSVTCDACHSGAGSGTASHRNGAAEVKAAAAYNAKSGAAAFNTSGGTCSNVSCHGGRTTPAWLTGAINVNTQCASCHAYGTAQYNGFSSGRHNRHVNEERAGCTECHDAAKLAEVHFNDLSTTAMTQSWKTLLASLNYTGAGGGTYGNCTVTCHGEEHTGERW